MASKAVFAKVNEASALPDHWEETLDSQLETIAQFQLEPKRSRVSDTLIIASWDPTSLEGVVEVCKGTHLDTMGRRGRVDLLYPEEVLFLLEKGRLCLRLPHTEQLASIEAGWSLLESAQISLETYLVYSSLKSSGNIVFRSGEIAYDGHEPIVAAQLVTYDVWLASSSTKFSRKTPPPPTFHVVVLDSNDTHKEYDLLRAIAKLTSSRKVEIKIATARDGAVDFFGASAPILPT